MHRFVAAAALLIFSACGERCPLVLYIPHLSFELSEADAVSLEQDEASVETCLNTICWTNTVTPATAGERATWDRETRRLTVEQSVPVGGGTNGARTYLSGAPKSDVGLTCPSTSRAAKARPAAAPRRQRSSPSEALPGRRAARY